MYLDLEFYVEIIGNEHIYEFRRNCLEFYVTASNEIRNRLPFNEEFVSCVSTFRLQFALYSEMEKSFPRVPKVCQTLGPFNKTKMFSKWQFL